MIHHDSCIELDLYLFSSSLVLNSCHLESTHGSNPHFSGSPETFKNVDIFVIECCESFFLMLLSLLNNHTGLKQVGASNNFSVVALVFAGHFLDVSHWVYIRCYLYRWLN